MTDPRERLQIERMEPTQWRRVRGLRLRALRESAGAFGRLLGEEEVFPPEAWRARLADPCAATFVATADARELGLVSAAPFRGEQGAAGLFGMWVAPEARGEGVADRLVEEVVRWARERGYARVLLDVGDDNRAAIALYERHGFVPSGVRGTLPPPREHIPEHQRVRHLGGRGAAEPPIA